MTSRARPTYLDAGDAAELADLLAFLADWLRQDRHRLEPSLLSFVGIGGYGIDSLQADVVRLCFLLGGDNGTRLLGQDRP